MNDATTGSNGKASGKHSRRDFFVRTARTAALAGTGGLLWGHLIDKSQATAFAIRPPGALPGDDFLATCIKCGLCVEACPYDALKLATVEDEAPVGTPYLRPREVPCYMCPDAPCIPPCPTGSLIAETRIEDARMGLAVLVDQETCLAYQGLRCEVCYGACPLIDKAITLEYQPQERTGKHAFFLPIVHSDQCTGCGLCEHACVLEKAAIKVLPIDLAKGELGANYQFGWKEDPRTRETHPNSKAPAEWGPARDDSRNADRNLDAIIDKMDDLEGILEP